MVEERLKKYFAAVTVYNKINTTKGKIQMLAGFFQAAIQIETDSFIRGLLVKFQMREGSKYAPANQDPEPPRFA